MPSETTLANMLRSDAELVASALAGVQDRFKELMRRYKGLVATYCYSRVAQRETAEELTQETFVRAFLALRNLKNPSAFATWLLSIARNVCTDNFRDKARTVPLETAVSPNDTAEMLLENKKEPAAADHAMNAEIRDKILAAIDGLGEESRVTLLLRLNGYSCEEISQALNVSVGTVTSRLTRARKYLREKLGSLVDPNA